MPERTLKLRVYPNHEQQAFLFHGFNGRQFAYPMGIILHQKEENDFGKLRPTKKQLAAELVGNPKTIRLLYRPKWRNNSILSQRLTELLVSLRCHQERAVSLAETFEGAVLPHPMAWLLEETPSFLALGLTLDPKTGFPIVET